MVALVLEQVMDEVELKALLHWLDISLKASLLLARNIHFLRGTFAHSYIMVLAFSFLMVVSTCR